MFHHTDGLGSTVALTDTVGLVTDKYTYDAYGMLLEHQGTFGNSFQFAGEQRDSSTGLDYLRARYYDSSLGRFISADPYSGSIGDPMSLHNYQYANANPTRYIDPSGYFSLGELAATGVITTILTSTALSLGYVGQKYLLNGGLSNDDVLTMGDAWFAGFAHGATGGLYSAARRIGSPEIRNDEDGAFLWQMGAIAGAAAHMGVGLKMPSLTTAQMGSWGQWVAIGWASGAANSSMQAFDGLMDGQWEWNDAFNLLAILTLALPVKVARSGNVDNAILASKQTKTSLKFGRTGIVADDADKVPDLQIGNKIPNEELTGMPKRRGQAPIGSDGKPVELHHRDQKPDGLIDEMTRTDHRGPGNYSRNHSNTGKEPSKIDREVFGQQRRKYWNQEYDNGRFDDLPK